MTSIQKQTIKGFKWSAIERITLQLIQFVITIVIARILTPEDYGLIGMLGVFLAISQSLIDSGFSNALIRKTTCTAVDNSTAFYFNIAVGIILFFVLFFTAPFIAAFYNAPILENITKVVAFKLIIDAFGIVQKTILTIKIDFKTQTKASFIAALFSSAIGVYLAVHGFGVWALVYQTLLNSFVNVLLLWVFTTWRPAFIFSVASFKDLFSFGGKLMISGVLHQIYLQFTTVLIGKKFDAFSLGNYTRANQFASLPSLSITDVLHRVTFPILSQIKDDNDRLAVVYRRYIKISSLVVFYIMLLLVALSKPLVLELLTDKWESSIILIQVIAFATMFSHISSINLNLLQVKGRTDLYLRLEIIKKTLAVLMMLFAVQWGVLAVCLALVLYTQIALVLNIYYTGKLLNIGYWLQFKDYMPYFFLSALVSIPAFMLTFSHLSYMLVMILGFVSSFLGYTVILYLVKDKEFLFLLKLIKNQLSKNKTHEV